MNGHAGKVTERSGRKLRGVVFAAVIATVFMFVNSSSVATSPDRGPLEHATLKQSGRSMILEIRTDRQISLRKLNRQPDFTSGDARYLCLEINRDGRGVISRICLGGKKNSHHRLGVSRTTGKGKVRSTDTIPARIKRSGTKKLVATFDPGEARLTPDPYEWRVSYADGRCDGAGLGVDCATFFPRKHRAEYEVRPVQIVGCTGGDGQVLRHGPRGRKRVAFTFDDGPGPYTDAVLSELRKRKVKATFFMLGQQVDAYPSTAREILSAGHELANHSTAHAMLPGESDVARASRTIRKRTGFDPCLFRPPYGAMSSFLRKSVKRLRMKSILWDVDTSDWRQPGSGSISRSITRNTRPGSIVLMHDAGGPRGQTVEALAGAIHTLRKRGYEFVTVTELLGNRFLYRPVK
ncbi:MAG: polysaccharide deacetylase family protein [Actinomycetota bacterium]|nr:polysaccharide deacetylase family protein [Actinomycetota bacterium]